jgi:hypothetical protein
LDEIVPGLCFISNFLDDYFLIDYGEDDVSGLRFSEFEVVVFNEALIVSLYLHWE